MRHVQVIVSGATGMIGQAVLAQCLGDPGIDAVLVVGRTSVGRQDDKLREILRADITLAAGRSAGCSPGPGCTRSRTG